MAVDVMYAQASPAKAFGSDHQVDIMDDRDDHPVSGHHSSLKNKKGGGDARTSIMSNGVESVTHELMDSAERLSDSSSPSSPGPSPCLVIVSPTQHFSSRTPLGSTQYQLKQQGGDRVGGGGGGGGSAARLDAMNAAKSRAATFPRNRSKKDRRDSGASVVATVMAPPLDTSLTAEEKEIVDKITTSRRHLESEIEQMIGELTKIGEEMNCTAECIQILQDNEECPTKKLLRRGRKLFNSKPKEGIQFLREQNLLNVTPEDIALFLFTNQLDKVAIGDYLGVGNEFNIRVLQNFVSLHNFRAMDLVKALRVFLDSFQLPGEAQKIDRMMEFFAHRYCNCNPSIFSSSDTCYILSFAIIMLNTSLHNPNVKDKPTVERFISMNRDINAGKELPHEMLKSFYEAIKAEPFQFHKESDEYSEMFFNPDYQGWLIKEGGRHKNWKKRWFILTDNCLYYFKAPADREPRGIIPLVNLEVRACSDKKGYYFEIVMNEKGTIKACKTQPDGRVVVGKHVHYRIQATSEDDRQEWMRRIRASISRNPFMEMLQRRRQRVTPKGPVNL